MASAAGTQSIASLYTLCIQSFGRLCGLLQNSEFTGQISPPALQEELGRFRVWAGNVGAHRNGQVSLDHRLREASRIHKKVTELLKDLDRSLKEAIAIVSHERQPDDDVSWSSDSSVSSLKDGSTAELEGEMSPTTELQDRFLGITHIITCLYRLSIVIRNPAPRDKLQKCASIDVSHYEFFDIQHTSNKFPKAEKYLIDRLGRANSRRRQLFKYHERYHDKLTRYIDLPQPEGDPANLQLNQHEAADDTKVLPSGMDENQGLQDRRSNNRGGPGTIATTANTKTTVSTYVQGPSDTIEVYSDAGQSQTSYATSVSEDTESKLCVPPPPRPDSALEGNPFECPYCFSIKIVHGLQPWMKHVFRDLRPYVCTFKDCLKPDRLFDSRHDWYNHEVEVHRREWFCNACHQPFATKALFANHLRQNHSNLFTETQLPAVVDRCERAIDSEQACPLCEERYPPRRLQSHLACHMQQLSLSTLPKMPEEIGGDRESLGAQASKLDEDKTEESFLDSISLDLDSSPPQEIADGASDTQNEIPDTRDETRGRLTTQDPGDYSHQLDIEPPPQLSVSHSSLRPPPPESMVSLIQKFNQYKLETKFCDGYVVHWAYKWEPLSSSRLWETSTWKEKKKVGSGGFGNVWLQEKEEEEGGRRGTQLRAVKVLLRDSLPDAGRSPELLALVKLDGYNHLFVKFLGWYEDIYNTFLAMEYIEYGDLSNYIKDWWAKTEAREIIRQVLEGLEVLHGKGICHRDLKPQNILLASLDPVWIKIADFGVSKRINKTLLRTSVGTPYYMAPEMLGAVPREFKVLIPHALDIWSLGALVHEILTSETPFIELPCDWDTDSISGLQAELPSGHEIDFTSLRKYCHGRIEFPTNVLQRSQVGEEGIAFVKSLLIANPNDRPTATRALQNPWLTGYTYTSNYIKRLKNEFSCLGVDLDLGDKENILMRQVGKGDIMQFLPSSAKVRVLSLLKEAITKGYNSVISRLLGSPDCLESIDSLTRGKLFQLAAEARQTNTIKLLLQNKADIGACVGNQTVLQWVIEEGNANIVSLFLENTADIKLKTNKGCYEALLLAIKSGHVDMVRVFLDKMVDINGSDGSSQTALQAAQQSGNQAIVRILKDRMARLN